MALTADASCLIERGGEYRFTIPVLPPSQNALHNIIWHQRKVELKPAARKWASDAKLFIPRIVLQSETSLIEVNATFHFQLLYKNGKVRRFDTANLLKLLLDTISGKVGFDDSRIRKGSWNSIDSTDEKVEVHLREVLGDRD